MGCKFPEMHPTQIQNAPWGADSSILEFIPQISATPYGVADIFMLEMGLEKPLRKHAGGTF